MQHGSGGRLTHELITGLFRKAFHNRMLDELGDSAVVDGGRLCFTTDSFVVRPLFFPGGDIGKLAVCGTVNDLAVAGGDPKYLTCGAIIEQGFEIEKLEKIVASMGKAAREAGVSIVAGDTKVVEKGRGDGIYLNTAGIGIRRQGCSLSRASIRPGDKVIINGGIAEHGLAVLSGRGEFNFKSSIRSDCAPLNSLAALIQSAGGVKFMRDPTRGGVAVTLNEIADGMGFGILLDEKSIPLRKDVKAYCALLGFDPLYIANEGKVIVIAAPQAAEKILKNMYNNNYGRRVAVIGEVIAKPAGKVFMDTANGGRRILDMPAGDQLPRIC